MISEPYKQQMDDLIKLLVSKGYLPEKGDQRERFEHDFIDRLSNDIAGDLLMCTAVENKGERIQPFQRWSVFTLMGESFRGEDVIIGFDAMFETYHDQQLLRMGSLQVMQNGRYVAHIEIEHSEALPPPLEVLKPVRQTDQSKEKRRNTKNRLQKRSRKQ